MKTIQLSQGYSAIVSAEDHEWLSQWKWSVAIGGHWVYARRKDLGGAMIRMHRLIMSAPVGVHVDHINGNGLDNRRSNLRFATDAQNQLNARRRIDNRSGFKGVYQPTGSQKFAAHIKHNKSRYYLGRFDTAEEAAMAYDLAAAKLGGEFARLNYPRAMLAAATESDNG